MAGDSATAPGVAMVRTRPRNRKRLIIDAAIVLFKREDYHRVGMDDIAAAAGVTAGALYRHFRSKQDLLSDSLLTIIDEYLAVATEAGSGGIDAVIAAVAQVSVASRDRGPSWHRLARHLPAEQQRVIRRRLRMLNHRVSAPLRRARPELTEADADFLAWAVLAVLASPFEHGVVHARPRLDELLGRAATAVWSTGRLPRPELALPAKPAGSGLAPASRREVLLSTASVLFREHGFDAVTMEAIGAAAGIAGPSVYNHYASKLDLLVAALERGKETLRFGLAQALAGAETVEQALEPVVRSYVVSIMRDDSASGLLFSEAHRLPAERVQAIRRDQREYVEEWVRLLPPGQAGGRVLVHAAFSVINRLAHVPHLANRPGFQDDLVGLALDVLHANIDS